MSEKREKLGVVIGFAALGSCITGVVSLIVALVPLFNGNFLAAGVCLAAAALAFGLLANAMFRR